MANKKIIKKSAKAEPATGAQAPEGIVATYNVVGGKTFNATQRVISLKNLHIDEGFNPRSKPGSIDEIVSSVKKQGIITPLLVRPKGQSGTDFRLIAGTRRYAAAKKAGLTEVPVVIRYDLNDDDDALAVAIAENSDDARHALSPWEMTEAYYRLKKAGWTPTQIAVETATSTSTVQRYLTLRDAPKDVKERLSDSSRPLSVASALILSKTDTGVRKQVMDKITSDTSTDEVKRLVRDTARENDVGSAVTGSASSKATRTRDAAITVWVNKRKITEQICAMCKSYVSYPENERDTHSFAALRGAIAFGLWCRTEWNVSTPPAFDPKQSDNPAEEKKLLAEFERKIGAMAKRVRIEEVAQEAADETPGEYADEEPSPD